MTSQATECRAEHARELTWPEGCKNPGVHAFCRTVVHVPSVSRNVFTVPPLSRAPSLPVGLTRPDCSARAPGRLHCG
eukprot:6440310-Prymnesium_polylepis.1